MTNAASDDVLREWITGTQILGASQLHSASSNAMRELEREIDGSILGSVYLGKPRRDFQAVEEELRPLWHVEKNWDSYGADAPYGVAIDAARGFLRHLVNCNLAHTRVLPSAEGGVAVAFFHEDRRAIAEFLNDGTSNLMLYDKSGVMYTVEPVDESLEAFRLAIVFYLFGEKGR